MKRIVILFAAVCAVCVLASESQAQCYGGGYGGYGVRRGVSVNVGGGGFYGAPRQVYGGYGYSRPVYRPVYAAPVVPVYGGFGPRQGGFYGGGFGGGFGPGFGGGGFGPGFGGGGFGPGFGGGGFGPGLSFGTQRGFGGRGGGIAIRF